MPETTPATMPQSHLESPDYTGLIRFLVAPLLEFPEALKVDCEVHPTNSRVWLRLAFENSDKGRVFGRGGRTIQAIRTVLTAAAQAHGHAIHLDIYGSHDQSRKPEVSKKILPKRPPSRAE